MPQIDHVIVLMLENRSFDHMLGFLDHPDPAFPGVQTGDYSNKHPKDGRDVPINDGARYQLAFGPGHHFEDIQTQIMGDNGGFVANYHHLITKKVRKLKKLVDRDAAIVKTFPRSIVYGPAYKKAIKSRLRANRRKLKDLQRFLGKQSGADRVMACFSPDRIPVLATLAKEFCVFTNWHAAVPGMTWPNRAYAAAATSDGEVNIVPRFYLNRTIYEEVSEAFSQVSETKQKRAWAVYHDGPAHTMVYPKLQKQKGDNFRSLKRLVKEIADPENAENPLPHYCFVEPNHGLLSKKNSNSQHPKDNKVAGRDFIAAEQLVADIYNALKANPALFERTLFLVTYDEHGGFYDHVVPQPGETVAPDGKTDKFSFTHLGIRVPAVAVSPFIESGTIDDQLRDHASIPRTVRDIFIGNTDYLTAREEWAKPIHGVLNRDTPRRGAGLPEITALTLEDAAAMEGISLDSVARQEKAEKKEARSTRRTLDDFEQSLVSLAANVEKCLDDEDLEGKPPEDWKWSNNIAAEMRDRMTNDRDLGNYLDEVSQRFQAAQRNR